MGNGVATHLSPHSLDSRSTGKGAVCFLGLAAGLRGCRSSGVSVHQPACRLFPPAGREAEEDQAHHHSGRVPQCQPCDCSLPLAPSAEGNPSAPYCMYIMGRRWDERGVSSRFGALSNTWARGPQIFSGCPMHLTLSAGAQSARRVCLLVLAVPSKCG